jgi:mercuric ion binding protein
MFRKILIALGLWALMAAPALAGNKRVTAHVEGLACPFCTYNLEKRITTLEGVPDDPDWQASVEKGTASFDWKADVPFDEAAVREQIRKAGFTPRRIEVRETTPSGNSSADTSGGASEQALSMKGNDPLKGEDRPR